MYNLFHILFPYFYFFEVKKQINNTKKIRNRNILLLNLPLYQRN